MGEILHALQSSPTKDYVSNFNLEALQLSTQV